MAHLEEYIYLNFPNWTNDLISRVKRSTVKFLRSKLVMSKQEIAEYTIFFPPLVVYMHMLFKILITDWKLKEGEPGKIQTESAEPDMSMDRAQKLEVRVP